MLSRDLALASISAAALGALASFLALRLISPSPKKHSVGGKPLKRSPDRSPFDPSKRKDYLSWDDYFMSIAFLSAERSKDPNRQEPWVVNSNVVWEIERMKVVLGEKNLFSKSRKSTACNWRIHEFMCHQTNLMSGAAVTSITWYPAWVLRCPNYSFKHVGACLVSVKGIILGIGYNGFPRGCSDDKLPWAKKSINGDPLETKYPYVVHAEVNAILNTNHASVAGQKLYVTMFPCNECAKIIIQSGISEVIYFVEKRLGSSDTAYIASHKLLSMAGVKIRRHQPHMTQITVAFEES